jgi:hypothetical protein
MLEQSEMKRWEEERDFTGGTALSAQPLNPLSPEELSPKARSPRNFLPPDSLVPRHHDDRRFSDGASLRDFQGIQHVESSYPDRQGTSSLMQKHATTNLLSWRVLEWNHWDSTGTITKTQTTHEIYNML